MPSARTQLAQIHLAERNKQHGENEHRLHHGNGVSHCTAACLGQWDLCIEQIGRRTAQHGNGEHPLFDEKAEALLLFRKAFCGCALHTFIYYKWGNVDGLQGYDVAFSKARSSSRNCAAVMKSNASAARVIISLRRAMRSSFEAAL